MTPPPAAPHGDPAALRDGHGAPVPAGTELHASLSWQAIDFISDLHLCQALPHTFAAFEAYLQTTPADAVFILGDLFELWVGDDMAQQPFEAHCVKVLLRTTR